MEIRWTSKSTESYISGIAEQDADLILAIREQVSKTLDLAESVDGWDCLMVDMWMDNLGRVISHVQDKKDAVGVDKGFRVGVQYMKYYNQIQNAGRDDFALVLYEARIEYSELFKEAFNDENFLMSFDELWQRNKFSVRMASQGQLLNFELKFA